MCLFSRKSDQKWIHGKQVVTSADHSMITIKDLEPYTEYYIQIFAENAIGKSEPSPQSVTFTTFSERKL